MATLDELKARLAATLDGYKKFTILKNKWDTEQEKIDSFCKEYQSLPISKVLNFSANAAEKTKLDTYKQNINTWIDGVQTLIADFPKKKDTITSYQTTFQNHITKINDAQAIGNDADIEKTVKNKVDDLYKEHFGNAFSLLNEATNANNPDLQNFKDGFVQMLKNGELAVVAEHMENKKNAGKTIVKDGVYTIVINSNPEALCNLSSKDSLPAEQAKEWDELKAKDEDDLTEAEAKKLRSYNKYDEYTKQDKQRTILHESCHLLQAKQGKMLQSEKGASTLTYDIFDEVEAFKVEGAIFNFIKLEKFIKAADINEATVATDSYYAKLPRKNLSINLSIEQLLPIKNDIIAMDLQSLSDFKTYLLEKGACEETDLSGLKTTDTLQAVLETKTKDGKAIWENLKLQKTW